MQRYNSFSFLQKNCKSETGQTHEKNIFIYRTPLRGLICQECRNFYKQNVPIGTINIQKNPLGFDCL